MDSTILPSKHRYSPALIITVLLALFSPAAEAQYMEKLSFDASDSANGYYLAIPPLSKNIRGVLVFLCSFRSPESLLPETRLHNIAAAGDLLTVYCSMGNKIYADPAVTGRINTLLRHIVTKYGADTSAFVLGGFDAAGTIALRFTEMAYQHPSECTLRPRAVFGVASSLDLSGLYRRSERQIKKNYFPPATGDAHFFLDLMNKELGTPGEHPENYRRLSPFTKEDAPETAGTATGGATPRGTAYARLTGNDQFLRQVPLRLYYDTDINWQLSTRRNSLYDTDLPDATELVNRLLLAGNSKAEFIASRLPGMRSNGMRHANAMSIVDETDCIQWIKRMLHILDPSNPLSWVPTYHLIVPQGWAVEHAYFPPPFAPGVKLKGIEDIRFPPGWADPKTDEYWAVAYLFWLDGGQKIDLDVLKTNLTIYYDELTTGGAARRNYTIPPDKAVPTHVTIRRTSPEPGDVETYTGTIHMFDYLGRNPVTLNVQIHLKNCSAQGHIPLFMEISPKPFDQPIWRELKKMKENFACEE